jgi:hypothetical protein
MAAQVNVCVGKPSQSFRAEALRRIGAAKGSGIKR